MIRVLFENKNSIYGPVVRLPGSDIYIYTIKGEFKARFYFNVVGYEDIEIKISDKVLAFLFNTFKEIEKLQEINEEDFFMDLTDILIDNKKGIFVDYRVHNIQFTGNCNFEIFLEIL